jgi:hypothetical protein
MRLSRVALASLAVYEGIRAIERSAVRRAVFAQAVNRAVATGRQLVVVGDPVNGAWSRVTGPDYGCGDVCVDLTGCPTCPVALKADVTKPLPLASDRYVTFVSCTLEYVPDPWAAWDEILRISGDGANVFMVDVQPWTLASVLYPGADSTIVRTSSNTIDVEPVTTITKLGVVAALTGLAWLAV